MSGVEVLFRDEVTGKPIPVSSTNPLPTTGAGGGGGSTDMGPTNALITETNVRIGPTNETVPASDTGVSGLNGRLQRIAQRLTDLIAVTVPFTPTDLTETNLRLGATNEAMATADTAVSGLSGRLQRISVNISGILTRLPGSLGSKIAGLSFSVTTSTEDTARIGIITEAAPASDTASSGLNGRLQRIAQNITALIASQPASLGQKAAAASMPVVESTEGAARIGAVTETAPATDIASSGLNGRLQRIAQHLSSLVAFGPPSAATDMGPTNTLLGPVTEGAPATDTASSGLNGRLQRVAQRLTSLIAQFPATLGTKAAAASLAVAWSTEDLARVGIVTEAAPASDTASSGLNGRLQRIAQNITALIATQPASLGQKAAAASISVTQSVEDVARMTTLMGQLPATLGAKAAAASLAVTASTEDVARQGIITETAPASDTAASGLNGRLQRIAQNLSTLIASNAAMVTLDQRITSAARLLSAAGTAGDTTLVKAGAATLYGAKGYNAANAVRFLKIYNSASAPTVGTGTPILTLALPPNAAFAFDWYQGLTFATGIAFTLTTAVADASAASVTAADIVGLNIEYT